jgi:tartronate-semialdehyde synthase
MKVAQVIIEILKKEGIRDAFGIPGAGINPVYQYMKGSGINHYLMRHEEACTHAADAYFRASHRLALAICTSGPAATNFVTGLYTAHIDSIPFLAITGQANSTQLGTDPFQCVNIAEIAKTVCKKASCLLDPEQTPEVFREAFYLMRSGRPGPVLIDIPLDIQQAEIDFNIDEYRPLPVTVPEPDPKAVREAVKMLASAKSPVIIMGGGVILSRCEKEVLAFAEALNIPVITTFMAKGGIPVRHPLNAGHAGIQVGQPIGNAVLLESDLVLGIGCRFTDRHTGNLSVYRKGRKFIHIDIEPAQIGKVFQPDLGIVSDAGKAVAALSEAVRESALPPFPQERVQELQHKRERLARKTDYDTCPIMPHRLFHEINRAFDDDTMFTVGCGNTQIWAGQLQDINKPRRFLPSGGAGTLGYEIPGAFGAKVACPGRTSVTVLGDFGFTFMGEEIAVASVSQKPIIVIILNNSNLGLIRQNQKGAYGFEHEIDMPYNSDGRVDYVQVAKGFGCRAERVTTHQELREALQRARDAGQTYVIDVICKSDQLCDMGADIASVKCWAPGQA